MEVIDQYRKLVMVQGKVSKIVIGEELNTTMSMEKMRTQLFGRLSDAWM